VVGDVAFSATPFAMMHTLIWIGGLVFLGFFALLAPVKTTIVPADKLFDGLG